MQRTKVKKWNEETEEWETLGEVKPIKNQPKKSPTAILTADWHLREDQPICRTDNLWDAQWKKITFITQLQQMYNCLVLCAGDLFNHWKPSPLLLTNAIRYLPKNFYTVYGNHDLPQWNLQLAMKSGVCTLDYARKIEVLEDCHWGMEPERYSLMVEDRKVLVWHVMTFPEASPPWPGCEDMPAETIQRKYKEYDIILTGHHHKTFVTATPDGRLLVNPGSLTRQAADQIDHRPCLFLWYADDNTIEKVIIPHEEDVISREHIDLVKDHDDRIERFVSQFSAEYKVGLSFEENLERFASENKVQPPVMEIIRRAIDG